MQATLKRVRTSLSQGMQNDQRTELRRDKKTPIWPREISLHFLNHSRQAPELPYSTVVTFSTDVCTLCAFFYSLKSRIHKVRESGHDLETMLPPHNLPFSVFFPLQLPLDKTSAIWSSKLSTTSRSRLGGLENGAPEKVTTSAVRITPDFSQYSQFSIEL